MSTVFRFLEQDAVVERTVSFCAGLHFGHWQGRGTCHLVGFHFLQLCVLFVAKDRFPS